MAVLSTPIIGWGWRLHMGRSHWPCLSDIGWGGYLFFTYTVLRADAIQRVMVAGTNLSFGYPAVSHRFVRMLVASDLPPCSERKPADVEAPPTTSADRSVCVCGHAAPLASGDAQLIAHSRG